MAVNNHFVYALQQPLSMLVWVYMLVCMRVCAGVMRKKGHLLN
jgi:hypothetical protein